MLDNPPKASHDSRENLKPQGRQAGRKLSPAALEHGLLSSETLPLPVQPL